MIAQGCGGRIIGEKHFTFFVLLKPKRNTGACSMAGKKGPSQQLESYPNLMRCTVHSLPSLRRILRNEVCCPRDDPVRW